MSNVFALSRRWLILSKLFGGAGFVRDVSLHLSLLMRCFFTSVEGHMCSSKVKVNILLLFQ